MIGVGVGTPGGGVRAPSPLSILGPMLVGWWNADNAANITVTGSGVSSWKDEIAGYDLVQATDAARPVWSATSFNGRGGVTFDGADDFLRMVGVPAAFPTGNGPGEIWQCSSQDAAGTDGTTRYGFAYGSTTAGNARATRRSVTVGNNRASYQAGGIVASNVADYTGLHYVRHTFDGANLRADQDGAIGNPVAATPSTGSNGTTMGASYQTTPSGYWLGSIHHLLVLAGIPDDPQLSALKQFYDVRIGV